MQHMDAGQNNMYAMVIMLAVLTRRHFVQYAVRDYYLLTALMGWPHTFIACTLWSVVRVSAGPACSAEHKHAPLKFRPHVFIPLITSHMPPLLTKLVCTLLTWSHHKH